MAVRMNTSIPGQMVIRGENIAYISDDTMTIRVLLMDDEPSIGEITGILLRKLGYDPVITMNGEDTVREFIAAKNGGIPFDIVILDLTIPGGIGGKEVFGLLREIDPGVNALVSSGDLSDPAVTEYHEHGFAGILAKPYNKKILDETIRRVLP